MVKISSTYIGVGDGKLGEGVYFNRKGKTGARQYKEHINEPNTEKQLAQKSRFKACVPVCKCLIGFFEPLWKSATAHQTPYNSLFSYIIKNALQLVGGLWVPDWTKIRFASGALAGFDTPGATNPSGQTIIYTWVDNSGYGGASPDDTFSYVFFNTSTYDPANEPTTSIRFGRTTQKRSDQTYSFSAPAGWTGNDVAVYGCFSSTDGTKASISHYFGTLTLH